MIEDTATWAFLLGFLSAISLIIGSLLGIFWPPRPVITSAMMAFGAGALLFALSVEIVAESYEATGFLPLAAGLILGGILFEGCNQILNRYGGFLRKTTTLVQEALRLKRRRAEEIIEDLSRISLFQALPPDQIAHLVPQVDEVHRKKGDVIIREGTGGDALFLVNEGTVTVYKGEKRVAEIVEGGAFGEMALIHGEARSATVAVASESARLFKIVKDDFERLLNSSPELREKLESLANARKEELEDLVAAQRAEDWRQRAARSLGAVELTPSRLEVYSVAMEGHKTAVLGIWLGILLDAIPESIVIGTSIVGTSSAPWGLVAGVFLANLPEALSSSVVMRTQKYEIWKILTLWSVIVVVTAIGAVVGNVMLRSLPHQMFAVIEGIAAGAMLTSIAETMLPEAYERGGWVVGLSTLAGFLAALAVKALAHGI